MACATPLGAWGNPPPRRIRGVRPVTRDAA